MWASGELRPVVNEYRVGTYVFNDRNTVASGAAALDDVALTIVATVASRRDDRAILDAGSKALSSDAAVEGASRTTPKPPSSRLEQLNEEHGYLALAGGDDLELGQQVRIVPNHVCVAVNLHEELVGVRDGRVELRWPVARGR